MRAIAVSNPAANPYAAPRALVAETEDATERAPVTLLGLSGRMGRMYYLAYALGIPMLLLMAVGLLAAMLSIAGAGAGVLGAVLVVVAYVLLLVLQVSAGVRRLHDVGVSGWVYLLVFIPFVNLILALYMLVKRGDATANAYGAPPVPASRAVKWGAAAAPIGLVLVGILAAIAIPAYHDYQTRLRAAQAAQMPQ